MKYSIITGNPIDGFELYGIFDSEIDAIQWANNDSHLPDNWNVIKINQTEE